MEDRKTAVAMLICIMFIMVYMELFINPLTRPPVGPHSAGSQPTSSQRQGGAGEATNGTTSGALEGASAPNSAPASGIPAANTAATAIAAATPNRLPTKAELDASPKTTIDNGVFQATFAHLGGRLEKLVLRDYRENLNSDGRLNLVPYQENTALPLGLAIGEMRDDMVSYSVKVVGGTTESDGKIRVQAGEPVSVEMWATLSDGQVLKKSFSIKWEDFLIGVDVSLGKELGGNKKVWLEWQQNLSDLAFKDAMNPSQFTVLANNSISHFSPSAVQATMVEPFNASWLAVADKYFGAILIPQETGINARYGREGNRLYSAVAGSNKGGTFHIFVGPKDYRILKPAGFELERSIDLGIFAFIAYPLLSLIRLANSVLHNYGLAIIFMTLALKYLFLPLTKASLKSMKAMQDLQPEMKALRERIKDPNQLNQEMLALYKRKGVNPMGGCLPVLVQIPVFFGLYSALLHSIELRHAPFGMWIQDLSAPEHLVVFGLPLPLLIIVMGAAMFIQQQTTPTPGLDPAQKKVMMFMPLVFTFLFFIHPVPSGLALYMLVNTLISIVQQAFLRSDARVGPFKATAIASGAIFVIGFLATLV